MSIQDRNLEQKTVHRSDLISTLSLKLLQLFSFDIMVDILKLHGNFGPNPTPNTNLDPDPGGVDPDPTLEQKISTLKDCFISIYKSI